MYDFEKYYADMDIKADANIDLSGLQIENPQGNPNEHVTNNVAYYVTGIALSNDGLFSVPVYVGVNDRVQITVRDGSSLSTHYAAIMHPLADILDAGVSSLWNPGKERERVLNLDSSGEGIEISYTLLHDGGVAAPELYSFAKAYVSPRYEFITNNGSDNVMDRISGGTLDPLAANQNVISETSVRPNKLSTTMRAIYMMLGINGKRRVSIKDFRNGLRAKAGLNNAVIGYDTFRGRMNQLSRWCAENNYGIDVKYYDRSMSDPLPDGIEDATVADYKKDPKAARAKHCRYARAVYAADRTRTAMAKKTSFDMAYGTHLREFLGNPRVASLVDNLTPSGDGVTALIPPIKDAVKGMFRPREEIETDFYDHFDTVYEELKDAMSILGRYLSKKTRAKIKRMGKEYEHYSSDDGGLAFDLDSIINSLQANYDLLGKNNGYYATGNSARRDCVTAYPRVFQINGMVEPDAGNVQASWCASPSATDPAATQAGLHFVTASSGDYRSSNYIWNKKVVVMTSDEVRESLVDMYNWILERDGKDVLDFHTDFEVGDTTFAEGYDSSSDSDIRVVQCKRLIEFVGGWMNLFKKCSDKEGVWAFVAEHPFMPGEGVTEWLGRLAEGGLVDWNLSGEYRIVDWETSSNTNRGSIPYSKFRPAYTAEWGIDPDSPSDIDSAVDGASAMVSAYKDMRSQLVARAFLMRPSQVVRAWLALEDVSDAISELKSDLRDIIWYQAFVNESVFTNRSVYLNFDQWLNCDGDDNDDYVSLPFTPWALPARFMVPVSMYRRVRKRYRNWIGLVRHRTVKEFDGVRWAEIRFYDLNVYSEYPQIEETPGNVVEVNIPATVENVDGRWYINFAEPLPEEVWNAGNGEVRFDDVSSTTVPVTFADEMSAYVPAGVEPGLTGEHVVLSVKVPPERSRNDTENKTPVTIHVRAPSLPYDEEIRRQAFAEYGPFSQDRLFEVVRYGDGGFPGMSPDSRVDGWKVFRRTSRRIEDMREGIGLYDKVAFLLSILRHEFGNNRVELINTWRSAEDQKGICTGGDESGMLSWHNYGMAAKILVYGDDCTTPIDDGGNDMRHLVRVARAFTEACRDGRIGAPCNVVWCGRLTVNPSLFDWEFLPIGVGHRDAIRFREAILAQKDPVKECSYVDVDAAGMVKDSEPEDGSPYVLRTSSAYRNAILINGHHYVSPDRIVNYSTPDDIVLYDLVEYIDLINLKMGANGNTLGDRGNMYEWKALNDSACTQLVRYFALTNNIQSAKALIAGDFVERYQAIEDAYYSTSVVDYVKAMLGSHYDDVYVTVNSMNDAGYISLASGRMYIRPHDQKPDNVPTVIDMHGQQRVDDRHVRRGVWRKGVFYGLDEIEIPYVESDGPVIDGYVDGTATYGDAMFLHQAVASELHSAFLDIRDMFERYRGAVMYDRFQDGPNAGKFDQLENEFGAIAAQDLMEFDELESILAQDDINRLADMETDGSRNGIVMDDTGNVSIYEKVVNNAQLAGMRKALRTSERMHITDRGNGLTPGEIYRAITEGRAPGAIDIMSRR